MLTIPVTAGTLPADILSVSIARCSVETTLRYNDADRNEIYPSSRYSFDDQEAPSQLQIQWDINTYNDVVEKEIFDDYFVVR